MIYDLSNETQIEIVASKLANWVKQGKMIDLKVYSPRRTLSQNRYLHLVLSYFALEYGEKTSYVKQEIFKKIVNPEIFKAEYTNPKTGEIRVDWRSSADLSKTEMISAIDRFKDYCSKEAGIYIPDAGDFESMSRMEIHVKNNQNLI